MSYSSQSFNSISVEIKVNIKDYNDVTSALIVDPKIIREKLIQSESKSILADIAECIVVIGPRPDRIIAKLTTRVNATVDVLNKIRDRVQKIETFIKKHLIRGTQFQAAFPDLIFKARESILKQNGSLQRFVSDEVLPIIFQFPGSGPILPDGYRNQDHYGQFNIELTKALSQGRLNVNWSIIERSLEWKISLPEIEEYDLLSEHTELTHTQSSSTPSAKTKKGKETIKERKDKS